jgi:phasin
MPKESFQRFEIPDEMRQFAEQGVAQARRAFETCVQAASEAVNTMEDRAQVTRHGAMQIAQKSMDYAEQNVTASFEFAQKLVQAKDASEVLQLQTDFLTRQLRALSEQVQDIGQGAAKIAMKAAVGE